MKNWKKRVLNESKVEMLNESPVLGDLVGKKPGSKFQALAGLLSKPEVALKFLQPNPDYQPGEKAVGLPLQKRRPYRVFNLNTQVNLQDDLSRTEIIVENDADEAPSKSIIEDLTEVYKHVAANASEEQAKNLPVKIQQKQNGGKVSDVRFIYTPAKDDVVFAFDPADFSSNEDISNLVEDLSHAGDSMQGNGFHDGQQINNFATHTELVNKIKTDGKTVAEILESPAYLDFIHFSMKMHFIVYFLTVNNTLLETYYNTIDALIKILKNKQSAVQQPAATHDDDDEYDPIAANTAKDPDPPIATDGENPFENTPDLVMDQPQNGHAAQAQSEETPEDTPEETPAADGHTAAPALPKSVNIVQNLISSTKYGSTKSLRDALKIGEKQFACIMSPMPYETLKSMIGGLPQQATDTIIQCTGGLDLVYMEADAGKPVMLASDPTQIDKAKLYNQVVHQLSGWYIFVPGQTGQEMKMLFLFTKKKDKAIFELKSYKPDIPLHIHSLSGNKWVPEFYTEQNTLKKQGCRTLLWSTDDSKFGTAAVGHAVKPAASASGATQSDAVSKPQTHQAVSQSELDKHKYLSGIIAERVKNFLSNIKGHTMRIFSPILNKSGGILLACNGGWHKLKDNEWKTLFDNYDNIKSFSPAFGPEWNTWVKKLVACFDTSSIDTSQFDVEEPLTGDQEKSIKTFSDACLAEFKSGGIDGLSFQIVAPGHKPKYNVNPMIKQGKGWKKQAGYTLTVMIPGIDPTISYGDDALSWLDVYKVKDEIAAILEKINKNQTEKIGLAVVLDDGFPS